MINTITVLFEIRILRWIYSQRIDVDYKS